MFKRKLTLDGPAGRNSLCCFHRPTTAGSIHHEDIPSLGHPVLAASAGTVFQRVEAGRDFGARFGSLPMETTTQRRLRLEARVGIDQFILCLASYITAAWV